MHRGGEAEGGEPREERGEAPHKRQRKAAPAERRRKRDRAKEGGEEGQRQPSILRRAQLRRNGDGLLFPQMGVGFPQEVIEVI